MRAAPILSLSDHFAATLQLTENNVAGKSNLDARRVTYASNHRRGKLRDFLDNPFQIKKFRVDDEICRFI